MKYTLVFIALLVLCSTVLARTQRWTSVERTNAFIDTVGCSVWPQPQLVTYGSVVASVDPNHFSITTNSGSQVLQYSIERFKSLLLFPFNSTATTGSIQSVVITVTNSSENLQLGVNESYSLKISNTNVTITSPEIWGAMRGLETLAQLIQFDAKTLTYNVNCVPVAITDFPRFQWRGLLIDSARHYLMPETIFRTIRAMSFTKFNTLHWHIVDAQSFPAEILQYPELSGQGSYVPDAIYTTSMVESVKNYALTFGIRVVLEFDVPGHAASWGFGYSNLTVDCPAYSANINNIPLNPTYQFTYNVLEGIINQTSTILLDKCMHMGGDEVVYGCWLNNSEVLNFMAKNNIKSARDLEQDFENKLVAIIQKYGRTMVAWEDLYDNGIKLPASSTIYEVWSNRSALQRIINSGYRAITAYGWYLDYQLPLPIQQALVGQWEDTWKVLYLNDPLANVTGNANTLALVLGGEAAMWGEQVDSTNIDSRMWPRACAVAERLWSARGVVNMDSAQKRLRKMRCRMAQLGVGAGPILPGFCPLPKHRAGSYLETFDGYTF